MAEPAQGAQEHTPKFIRMPVALARQLEAIARAADRSFNAQINRALREWLAVRSGCTPDSGGSAATTDAPGTPPAHDRSPDSVAGGPPARPQRVPSSQ